MIPSTAQLSHLSTIQEILKIKENSRNTGVKRPVRDIGYSCTKFIEDTLLAEKSDEHRASSLSPFEKIHVNTMQNPKAKIRERVKTLMKLLNNVTGKSKDDIFGDLKKVKVKHHADKILIKQQDLCDTPNISSLVLNSRDNMQNKNNKRTVCDIEKNQRFKSVNAHEFSTIQSKRANSRYRTPYMTIDPTNTSDRYHSTKIIKNFKIDSLKNILSSSLNNFNIDGIKEEVKSGRFNKRVIMNQRSNEKIESIISSIHNEVKMINNDTISIESIINKSKDETFQELIHKGNELQSRTEEGIQNELMKFENERNCIDKDVNSLFEKYKDLLDKHLVFDLSSFQNIVKEDTKLQGIELIFKELSQSIGEQCKEQGELLNSLWQSYINEYTLLFYKKIHENVNIIKLMNQEINDIK